jgi:16S rRNA (cytidine1402-2'-O)-methyltransferase
MDAGILYIVATPIGNLGDITLRALEILRTVGVVYAEDTRVSQKLLNRYEIKTPLSSYREAASPGQVEKTILRIISDLQAGRNVAFVSDAGSPGISDPGQYLVERVVREGLKVEGLPGATAVSTLISIAGTLITRPLFVGFLPKKKGHQTLMGKLRIGLTDDVCDTLVFYESPERLVKLLEELMAWEMPLWVCVGRELTKLHEEVLRGSLEELYTELKKRPSIKGEICLIVTKSRS